MTTKPHPTDAMEIPEPGHPDSQYDWLGRPYEYTADDLRAERIAAYNLGRESMREEAAKLADPRRFGENDKQARRAADAIQTAIRSMKHEQQ